MSEEELFRKNLRGKHKDLSDEMLWKRYWYLCKRVSETYATGFLRIREDVKKELEKRNLWKIISSKNQTTKYDPKPR